MEEDQEEAARLAQLTARVHHLSNETEALEEENKQFEQHLSQSQISMIRSQNRTLTELAYIHSKNSGYCSFHYHRYTYMSYDILSSYKATPIKQLDLDNQPS